MEKSSPASSRSSDRLERRSLLRNGLLAGAGLAAATATSTMLTGTARAGSVASARAGSAASTGVRTAASAENATVVLDVQTNWWWCTVCDGLFHSDGNGDPAGVCAGGQSHTNGGTMYEVPWDNPSQTGVQNGWRWCHDCDQLFWGSAISSSACWAHDVFVNENMYYAPHTFGSSTIYDMMYGSWSGNVQAGWRYCGYCRNLVWGNDAADRFCAGGFGTSHPYHVLASSTIYYLFNG